MNLARWRASTLARYVEERGELLAPFHEEDDPGEQAIFVNTLGAYAHAWRYEAEVARQALVQEPRGVEDAVLAWLRENGAAPAKDVGKALWRFGGLPMIRATLESLVRQGRVTRTLRGHFTHSR